MILFTALFLILFEAIPEALSLREIKTVAGIIEFIYRMVITVIIFAWLVNFQIFHCHYEAIGYIIGGYLLLRFALFDIIFNWCAGLPIFFIGKTKLYDKFWYWFFKTTHFPINHFFITVKFIGLIIGITWLLK